MKRSPGSDEALDNGVGEHPSLAEFLSVSEEVSRALSRQEPVVALESAVLTHGLPPPRTLQVAQQLESAVRAQGAIPATVAVLDGRIRVGLSQGELITLGKSKSSLKLSRREFAGAIMRGTSGGTTVAGTMFAAHRAGIEVFATGGIGGVHIQDPFDISADLQALLTPRWSSFVQAQRRSSIWPRQSNTLRQ